MDYIGVYKEWLSEDELTPEEKRRLNEMTDGERKECFYAPLEFGTAGMRGTIDLGIAKMNRFTVRRATKGLADFILSLGEEAAKRGVVIAYDTRRCSAEFAVLAAKTLSAAGVRAYIYEDVRPVPMCSFAVRHLGATAGIMITASHNPKEYNGYKVYGDDGAQMSPESTAEVVKIIDKTPYFGIKTAETDITPENIKGKDGARADEFITVIGESVDARYFDAVTSLALSKEAVAALGGTVKIVYTPVHGTGYMPVTKVLAKMGIVPAVVPEQARPDTEFSTVRVPNPEEADTLSMGVALAEEIGSDIVIGTDPDADRMGVAVRDNEGKFVLLTGNQIGVLMEEYILRRRRETGTLPKNGAVVKTIVTTDLARKVADSYGVTTFDVLTGFKFIGEKIKEWETSGEFTYLFGFEESYGSLAGTYARDKDAVAAAMIFAEMVCYYAGLGLKVYDVLQDMFRRFGYYSEQAISIAFAGVGGMDKMRGIMQKLREEGLTSVDGARVAATDDLLAGVRHFADGEDCPTGLPATNALKLHLAGGDWVCVRPSGTEPKLKIYASAAAESYAGARSRAAGYLAFMKKCTE